MEARKDLLEAHFQLGRDLERCRAELRNLNAEHGQALTAHQASIAALQTSLEAADRNLSRAEAGEQFRTPATYHTHLPFIACNPFAQIEEIPTQFAAPAMQVPRNLLPLNCTLFLQRLTSMPTPPRSPHYYAEVARLTEINAELTR